MSASVIHKVRRPSRYIDGEWNAVRKPEARIRIGLAFPDTYEVGMSHLGLKILYGLVNNVPDAAAERVFAPWMDMEAELRRSGLPLTTLETGTPLHALDAVGFSLQYELAYTNVLQMLDLGGVPLRAEDRTERHPIVLAGGPTAMNPAPLSPFIDAFILGDGEDIIPKIIWIFDREEDRNARLRGLSELEGVYVPAYGPKRVRRQIVEDLDTAFYPTNPVVAHQAVHDRVAVEISRGCPRGCRFCQAGMLYRPLRERSLERIMDLAEQSLAATGYRDLSFTSLSAGDYSCLLPLLQEANRRFRNRHVALSLPSLRVGALSPEIIREIKSERKSGFTIAPEAGTDRLRKVINKDITDAEFFASLDMLFGAGWDQIKLYFMIGLPTEEEDDIAGIVRMVKEGLRAGRTARGRKVAFNLGVSSFVPKPHTPFQWNGQLPMEELRRRQRWLRDALPRKHARFKGQAVELSVLEAVFARGGPETADLIEAAYREGCRFDAWTEGFDRQRWERAMDRTGIGWEAATRGAGPGTPMPWDMVDPGFSEEFLARERMHALEGRMTDECRRQCSACGLECGDSRIRRPDAITNTVAARKTPHPGAAPVLSGRFRIRFGRTGTLRFLSHRETMDLLIRALNRAGIPMAYSKGFHPHPRVSFGPPLPVGVESDDEYIDVNVEGAYGAGILEDALRRTLPEGIPLFGVRGISTQTPSLGKFVVRYDYVVNVQGVEVPADARSGREKPAGRENPFSCVREIEQKPGEGLLISLEDGPRDKARLAGVLTALGLRTDGDREVTVRRIGLWGRVQEEWVRPKDA